MPKMSQIICLAILSWALPLAADESELLAELQERLQTGPESALLFFRKRSVS